MLVQKQTYYSFKRNLLDSKGFKSFFAIKDALQFSDFKESDFVELPRNARMLKCGQHNKMVKIIFQETPCWVPIQVLDSETTEQQSDKYTRKF